MVLKKNHFSEEVFGTRAPLETPPPFMANTILNFHFDYPHPSLTTAAKQFVYDDD